MIETLQQIAKDNWGWRKQIANLAVFDLKKKARGAALGWIWFLIKPAMYVGCFWFALSIGLRSGHGTESGAPYILWLASGIVPWFFMSEMITSGCNALRRYPYLVNKIKFPISAISSICTGAALIVHLILMAALMVGYFACGMPLDLYLLQLPLAIFLMFAFWNVFSILLSPLSALSKDVANLMKAISTPLFWLSGVIFNMENVGIGWIQTIMLFNPVTFFGKIYRAALVDKVWIWEDPAVCLGFLAVFAVCFVLMLVVSKRLAKDVADVL